VKSLNNGTSLLSLHLMFQNFVMLVLRLKYNEYYSVYAYDDSLRESYI
jgi:hypothetical protein